METYAGAEAFVEVLNAYRVEYIFMNPGIDTVPIQVTLAKFKSEGKSAPKLVLCLDESVAMAAAHGNYMVSGRPQVVLVHRELGTLQVGGALHNAYLGRVPVILCAGLAPSNGRLTWQNKPYDQGSMVRNCVKWEHEVSADENLAEVAQKALQIATTEPCGPVYLAPSLEVYKNPAKIVSPVISEKIQSVDSTILNKVADILISAQNPLVLVGHAGRHHESVDLLVTLAETIASRVITGPVRMNFPTSHPLCAGIDPIGGGSRAGGHYISEADVLLIVDYDLPYAAAGFTPSTAAKIIYIDSDPVKKIAPLWGRAPEVYIEADSRSVLSSLRKIVQDKLTSEQRKQLHQRALQFEIDHQKIRLDHKVLALSQSKQKPISPDYLCYCISQVIEKDTIIVNQTITHSSFVGEQIYRTQPGTFLSCAGGSIGWALGAGLGVKLAAPDKTVISLMGDGAFVWGCPVATLWTSRSYKAPFLAVIFNNQAYAAIKGLVQRAYGVDNLSTRDGFESGVNITPPPDYVTIAQGCGAYGRKVDIPEEVLPALKEALNHVRQGTSAVLDINLV